MPIELSTPIHRVSQDEYHAIDRRALGLAFDIHNEFGRLMDEVVYKTELATRCLAAGMKVVREARARVTHGGFLKDYFIDCCWRTARCWRRRPSPPSPAVITDRR